MLCTATILYGTLSLSDNYAAIFCSYLQHTIDHTANHTPYLCGRAVVSSQIFTISDSSSAAATDREQVRWPPINAKTYFLSIAMIAGLDSGEIAGHAAEAELLGQRTCRPLQHTCAYSLRTRTARPSTSPQDWSADWAEIVVQPASSGDQGSIPASCSSLPRWCLSRWW